MGHGHEYLNAFIQNSATITEKAGTDLTNPRHLAVMYDTNGNVVIATSGDKAIGLVLSDTPQNDSGNPSVKAGRDLNILIKYIGLGTAGGAIVKGDLLTVNATGQVTTAASGDFIFGRAFTAATAAGETVQVQINPMGYYGGGATTSGVQSVTGGAGITVDNTDPTNPIVSLT